MWNITIKPSNRSSILSLRQATLTFVNIQILAILDFVKSRVICRTEDVSGAPADADVAPDAVVGRPLGDLLSVPLARLAPQQDSLQLAENAESDGRIGRFSHDFNFLAKKVLHWDDKYLQFFSGKVEKSVLWTVTVKILSQLDYKWRMKAFLTNRNTREWHLTDMQAWIIEASNLKHPNL